MAIQRETGRAPSEVGRIDYRFASAVAGAEIQGSIQYEVLDADGQLFATRVVNVGELTQAQRTALTNALEPARTRIRAAALAPLQGRRTTKKVRRR